MRAGALCETAGPIPYDVSLPEAGLGWERVGPLFERYSVGLIGLVDSHWAEAYERVVGATPSLRRFRLDTEKTTVSFTCRATDGPVEVMGVLKILEGLLERVNREASFAAARLPVEVETDFNEVPDPRRGAAGFQRRSTDLARSPVSK